MSNNKQYSNIPLKDIFISENGDTDLKKEDVNGRGLPIITSGKSNFGILGKSDIVAKTFSANTITVDMFGYSAFRDHPYKMVTHARVFSLSRKDGKELSLGAGLYLTTAMSYFEQIFDYNNMCSWNKIQNLTVLLPVKEGEEIDYEYMEERIRELEEERIRELETYLNVSGLSTSILTEEDKSLLQKLKEGGVILYKPFELGRLFSIKKGKRLTKADQISGQIAFIGASADNHGITGRIGNMEHLHKPNTITVSYNGSVGEAFYQEETYWASDDVMPYYPNFDINENIACYLIAMIKKVGKSYSYTQKWTWEKMNADVIELPVLVDSNKNPVLDSEYTYHDDGYIPDFDFMGRYIDIQKKSVIQSVNAWRQKEIQATRSIANITDSEEGQHV